MTSLNFQNHNSEGNPHQQYDTGKVYQFSKVDSNIAGANGYGFVKVLSFKLANKLYSLPTDLQTNVVKRVYIEFSVQDTGDAMSLNSETVLIDAEVSTNSKQKPLISFSQSFLNLNQDEGITTKPAFIKQTLRPDLVDSDGAYPAMFDVYVSMPINGRAAVTPKQFRVLEYTTDATIPLGPMRSSISTVMQKFDAAVSNYESFPAISKSAANLLSDNQTIINPNVVINGTDMIVVNSVFDFNQASDGIGKTQLYIVNEIACLNAPFDNATLYYVKNDVIFNGWKIQSAMSSGGVKKERILSDGAWSSWTLK